MREAQKFGVEPKAYQFLIVAGSLQGQLVGNPGNYSHYPSFQDFA